MSGAACVVASSEQEALADVPEQLETCLQGYGVGGVRPPSASDARMAAQKVADSLQDCESERPGCYPQPSLQRMMLIRASLTQGDR
ncbi:hypothetical protein TSOC_008270 [Tetrabaena socialis]|uniref:Uncharacterized protein n=1 Tax=Tetrabaena socialis TaxID=47790 RepID=A0A2J7ZYW0_9CHLO|nr:hypothetical protein TSOC_008270 [Tetrabaena socialis]|eukprot:PNH05436.1 hypothetical protein TSOC_008270 [Tetrabaena socialis]